MWKTGGKNWVWFFSFQLNCRVFWVSVSVSLVVLFCKMIFGFLFSGSGSLLCRFDAIWDGGVARRIGGVFVVFPSVFFLLVGMKDEGCWGKVASG